jgi:plastocyanin
VRARHALVVLTGAAALAAAPGPATAAKSKSKRVTIGVFDNNYSPAKKTVTAGTTVRWRWDDSITDVHDVKLSKAPKGVKKFQTEPLAAGDTYSKKLTKAGTYRFICTFHEGMRMTIRVKTAPKRTRR